MLSSNFLFAQLAEGIHSTSTILLCKLRKLYQSLFANLPLPRSFPTFECVV